MSERLQFMGQREAKKLLLQKLGHSITGLRSTLRTLLNPFNEADKLDENLIADQALELAEKISQYKKVLTDIQQINTELGD